MMSNVAQKVSLRQERDEVSRSSGVILTSTGWIDGGGIDLLTHIVETFQIDVVLVIGHDRLYSSLQAESVAINKTSGRDLVVAKISRSGGTVQRTEADKRRLRRAKIHDYFYGTRILDAPQIYGPARLELQLHKYTLLRCGDEKLSQSMVPLGSGNAPAAGTSGLSLSPVQASQDMLHCLLGVLYTPTQQQRQQQSDMDGDDDMAVALLNSNVAGFLYVVEVNLEMNVLTVLSPSPAPLPGSNLLLGTIKWVE